MFAAARASAAQSPVPLERGSTARDRSWTERARSLRGVTDAETFAAELEREGGLAEACTEPGFANAWLSRTDAILQTSADSRASPAELERCAQVARAAASALRSAEGSLRAELHVIRWQLERGSIAEAIDSLDRADTWRTGAPLLAPQLDLFRIVIARRAGDLDAVTATARDAREVLERLLEADAAKPESRATWLGYHADLAAHIASELGRARLDAGLPELAAQAFAVELAAAERISADPLDAEARVGALVRHAQDQLWLALGTERFALALEHCDRTLNGDLELLPAERADFEIGRAVARSENARGRADELPGCLAELRELARRERTNELEVDASQRASVELALADAALRARAWDTVHDALAACDAAVDAAGGVSREPWLARSRASSAAFAVRLALETAAPAAELSRARDVLRERFEPILVEWERRTLRPGGVGFLYWGTQRLVVSELISAEVALDPGASGAEAALAHLVRAQRVGTLARSLLGDWAPDWHAVRDELADADGGWCVLFPAMDRSHLFLIDGSRVEHVELPSRDQIARAATELRRDLQSAPGSVDADERARRLESESDALGDLVLRGPARDALRRWRRVRVAGAELCQGLPFECLRLDGEWLGCSRAVSHVPSLPVAAALARRARLRGAQSIAAAHDFVLFAEPALAPATRERWHDQASIPLAPDDERALTANFGSGRALVLRGAAASLDALDTPPVADCTLLGFLTHGVIANEHERSARLLLAPGKRGRSDVGGEDIDTLARTPPCVLLCACGSAGGPQRLGDDTGAHLASAFLLRGTDVVLVSRGDVSYHATVALTARVLNELARGAVPDEALRAARASLASSREFADPYYFGLVSLTGLADRHTFALPALPRESPAIGYPGWIAIVVLALAAGIALGVRARRAASEPDVQIGSSHHAQ